MRSSAVHAVKVRAAARARRHNVGVHAAPARPRPGTAAEIVGVEPLTWVGEAA